ncbi:hypothetical protein [Caulobacter segnis]
MAHPRAGAARAVRLRGLTLAILLVALDAAPVFALGDGTRPGAGLPICSSQ